MRPIQDLRQPTAMAPPGANQSLRDAYAAVAGLSSGDRSYHLLVALSTAIAAFGLLADSTAVVIGAMIVAPLMGPILGLALGLCAGDRSLVRRAALTEVYGVALCLALAFLIGRIPLNLGVGTEILARTQPTIYDLLIAIAAGAAGAYATVDTRVSPSLPGVAIAVALAPPLASCGLCLGMRRPELAKGAFLLFGANLVAIQVAASTVFIVAGLSHARDGKPLEPRRLARRFGLSVLALIVFLFILTRAFLDLAERRLFEEHARKILVAALQETAGAELESLRVESSAEGTHLAAVVMTPREIEPAAVAAAEARLRAELDPTARLVVRSLPTKDADASGPVFASSAEGELDPDVAARQQLTERSSAALEQQLSAIAGAELVGLQVRDDGRSVIVTVDVRTPQVIGPSQVAAMQAALGERLRRQVLLTIRSIPTRVATAVGFVDPVEATHDFALKPALERRLQEALVRQLANQAPAARLTGVRAAAAAGQLTVTAEVATPETVTPAQVAAIEAALVKHVRPDIRLLIRSELTPLASASGYVPAARR